MPLSKKINKKTKNSQSLIEYAKKLKQLNKFDIEFEGNVANIIENPKEWAKEFAEQAIIQNIPRYLEAKKLGKEFANGISKRSNNNTE